jgi:hypothetical protein
MNTDEVSCRLGLISWPVYCNTPKLQTDTYIILGEIYDKDIVNNLDILTEFNDDLQFLYPFKAKKEGDRIKIYNEEDFVFFRKKYKLTCNVILHNYNESEKTRLVFRTPCLFDITCLERLFKNEIRLYKQPEISLIHKKVFIVIPNDNPVTRGKQLNECISSSNGHNSLFILVGDKYGLNRDTTSTLMKRYLLSFGVYSNNINKSIKEKFPESILESLELIKFISNDIKHDIFISCQSSNICKIMSFIRDSKIPKDIKIQFICQ